MDLVPSRAGAKVNKETLMGTVLPLLFIAATAGLFFLFTYPKYNEIQPRKDQINQLATKKDTLGKKLTRLNDLVDFKEVMDQNSNLINTALPSEANVPLLLTQVQQIAKENGLEIRNLTYSSSGGTSQLEANKVNINMSAEGSFSQIQSFFYTIEKAARVLEYNTIRFSSANSGRVDGTATQTSQLEVNLSLSSPYLYVESKATTEDPISIDIRDQAFLSFINKLKEFKTYSTVVDTSNIGKDNPFK